MKVRQEIDISVFFMSSHSSFLNYADMQAWENRNKMVFKVYICFGHLLELEDAFESDK